MNPKEISPQAYKEVLEHVRTAPSPTLIKVAVRLINDV